MEGLPDPGQIWSDFTSNPVVQLAATLIVIYVVMLWLGTAYWAFRDMQARTENPILPYFASALIIFFTPVVFLFGVVLYLIVRPRETLAEVYERSLAEESLLAEVEKNELCPVCRDRGAQEAEQPQEPEQAFLQMVGREEASGSVAQTAIT